MNQEKIMIDGHSLSIDVVKGIIGTPGRKVELAEHASEICKKTRGQIDKWLTEDAPVIYGINTGLGNLKDTVLSPEEHMSWNKTIPYPHAVGMGGTIDPKITKTALLIRSNVLARGYSAVRVELIERMLSLYNAGISPVIYELGSTGLSDLGPLAQSAMVVAGAEEAEVFYKGERLPAREALSMHGLDPVFPLHCKEVLSQMNGSSMTQAIALVTYIEFETLFDTIRPILKKGDPNFYTAVSNTLKFIRDIIEFENNISCDNPLLFEVENEEFEAVMGCNCSNTQVGYVMDLLTTVVNDLAKWYVIRMEDDDKLRLGKLSKVSQLDQLVIPASADSIATKGNQEDHVEFSYGAARKARKAVALLEAVVL